VGAVATRAGVSGRSSAAVAAVAIALLWGAIPIIVALEQRLSPELRWLGHAGFHLWTATLSAALCGVAVAALRSQRVQDRLQRVLVAMAAGSAGLVAATNAVETVAAHPSLRSLHDVVNLVGAPAGWILLAVLVTVVIVGAAPRRQLGTAGRG
jgi:hypothetical protein